jgi:hypothetical protein
LKTLRAWNSVIYVESNRSGLENKAQKSKARQYC